MSLLPIKYREAMKMLLGASFVLATAVLPQIATADELPRQFHGHWCGVADSDEGMRRVSKPCKGGEDVDSMTVTSRRVYNHADDGSTYQHCNVVAVANYKPRDPSYRNTYLARLSCDDPRVDGTYWFELIDGKLQHRRSSRSL
jgi:hypothetical protein